VESTGAIKADAFELETVAGAYWRGDEKNAMLQVRGGWVARVAGRVDWQRASSSSSSSWECSDVSAAGERRGAAGRQAGAGGRDCQCQLRLSAHELRTGCCAVEPKQPLYFFVYCGVADELLSSLVHHCSAPAPCSASTALPGSQLSSWLPTRRSRLRRRGVTTASWALSWTCSAYRTAQVGRGGVQQG
jgi:hypothetical protein